MRCVSHTGYFGHGNSKGEARRRRHYNNSKRRVRNLKQRNIGSKLISPKQGLASAEVLTMMGAALHTIDYTKLGNLT